MYREVEGDLFDPVWKFDAIGHGVNLVGVMGSGIAPKFKELSFPMFEVYKASCADGSLQPGDVMEWTLSIDLKKAGRPFKIYNMATQIQPGANAAYVYVAMALMNMRDEAKVWNRACGKVGAGVPKVEKIGIPLIGCGIGGLEWPRVQYLCKQIFERDEEVMLTVVHKK